MKKFFIVFVLALPAIGLSQVSLDLESGVATFGYNDVRIPGENGSRFSLSDEFGSKPVLFFRTRLSYTIAKRHVISALYAPLTIKGNGTLNRSVDFEEKTFGAGREIKTTWKFNSYRLSYYYNVLLRERFTLGLGLSCKIRGAKIALNNDSLSAEKTNLGVVPLIRFYADWAMSRELHLIVDGDALVGTQGRAEDVFLGLAYQISNYLDVKAGYRILEGGANNKEVYNFSAVHYGVLGLRINLR